MGLFDDLSGTGGGAASGVRSAASSGISSNKGKTGKKDLKTGKKSANISPFSPSIGGGSGDISKTDRQAAKKTKTTAKIENVAGDVVAVPVVSDNPLTVEEVKTRCPSWVGEWSDLRGVPDIRKASPLVFRDCCRYIGETYIKPSRMLRDTRLRETGRGRSTCAAYDPQAVAALYSVFLAVCDMCDKTPFESTFSAFSGVSMDWLCDNNQKLTSYGIGITKRIHRDTMDAIKQTASRDPVGRLAILNNEYWSGSVGSDSGGGSVASSMPVEQTFGLIGTEKLD